MFTPSGHFYATIGPGNIYGLGGLIPVEGSALVGMSTLHSSAQATTALLYRHSLGRTAFEEVVIDKTIGSTGTIRTLVGLGVVFGLSQALDFSG